MPPRENRGSLLALRERYLWLWRQMHKIEGKLKITATPTDDPPRRTFWAQRMKQQLKRQWP